MYPNLFFFILIYCSGDTLAGVPSSLPLFLSLPFIRVLVSLVLVSLCLLVLPCALDLQEDGEPEKKKKKERENSTLDIVRFLFYLSKSLSDALLVECRLRRRVAEFVTTVGYLVFLAMPSIVSYC